MKSISEEQARALENAIDRRRLTRGEAEELVHRVIHNMDASDKGLLVFHLSLIALSGIGLFVFLAYFISMRIFALVLMNPVFFSFWEFLA